MQTRPLENSEANMTNPSAFAGPFSGGLQARDEARRNGDPIDRPRDVLQEEEQVPRAN